MAGRPPRRGPWRVFGRAGGYAARRSSPIPSSKRPMRSRLIVGCVAIPSSKRPMRSVLAAVRAGDHLTVEEIAASAHKRIGSISTQAVYDVLAALVRIGLVRRIEPAGSPARFETRVQDNHHHIICRCCDARGRCRLRGRARPLSGGVLSLRLCDRRGRNHLLGSLPCLPHRQLIAASASPTERKVRAAHD